jgi:hypothetical protein
VILARVAGNDGARIAARDAQPYAVKFVQLRNSWKGHNAPLRPAAYDSLLPEIHSCVVDLWNAQPHLRSFLLYRLARVRRDPSGCTIFREILIGDNPEFALQEFQVPRGSRFESLHEGCVYAEDPVHEYDIPLWPFIVLRPDSAGRDVHWLLDAFRFDRKTIVYKPEEAMFGPSKETRWESSEGFLEAAARFGQ